MSKTVDGHYSKLIVAGESPSQHQRPVVTFVAATAVAKQHQRYGVLHRFGSPHDSRNRIPSLFDADGTVDTPGTRVRRVVLDDGTVIVDGGTLVPGTALTVATNDFLARGGDQYPYRGARFTNLGVTYQQALATYIQDPDGLNGTVTSADYPEGGEGRINRLP